MPFIRLSSASQPIKQSFFHFQGVFSVSFAVFCKVCVSAHTSRQKNICSFQHPTHYPIVITQPPHCLLGFSFCSSFLFSSGAEKWIHIRFKAQYTSEWLRFLYWVSFAFVPLRRLNATFRIALKNEISCSRKREMTVIWITFSTL